MNEFKLNFRVSGMTCAMCAKAVENELRKIKDVSFASVNVASETAFIISEKQISFNEISEAVKKSGYIAEKDISDDIDKKRYYSAKINFIISLLLTVPLSILMLFDMHGVKIPYFIFYELIIGGFVIFYCGRKTIKSAWIAFIHFHTNMDTLIFLGSVFAWLTTVLKLLDMEIASFGTVGAMIVAIHITGRFIESRLRDKASKEVKALFKLQAKEASVIVDDKEILMPISSIKKDFIVVVRPGDRIPVDGVIINGVSSVDESMITGESIPVQKQVESQVTGGSLNLTGILNIKVTKVGEETFLSNILKLIQEAQGSKIPIQALADKITLWFVPMIITLALISGLVWFFFFDSLYPLLTQSRNVFPWIMNTDNPLSFAVFVFVATMVIACPCALGLATPMALIKGTGIAAKKGLIIRNAEAIQTSKDINTVIMDKTGTITIGQPKVVEHSLTESEAKTIAFIEKNSNHPLATAISNMRIYNNQNEILNNQNEISNNQNEISNNQNEISNNQNEISKVQSQISNNQNQISNNNAFFNDSSNNSNSKSADSINSNSKNADSKNANSINSNSINNKIELFEEISGLGIKAVVNGNNYYIGKPENASLYENYYIMGKTVVEVIKNNNKIGHIVIEDLLRDDSISAVKRFKEKNINPVLASGDNEITAKAVAKQTGIEEVFAGITPHEKLDIVRSYQGKGNKVIMVGDGMNDAASLKGADVGIAIGNGMDLAIDNADIVIVKGGLSKIADVTEISQLTFKTIKQNLFGAFIYNIIAIPMAMAGLLHPAIAEIAMALSSITVVLNSMRIKK